MTSFRMLVVSAYYPPCRAVGGKRFAFLNREFINSGIGVSVLTLPDDGAFGRDHTLIVPGDVVRSSTLLPYPIPRKGYISKAYFRLVETFLGFPDPFIGWVMPAIYNGVREVKKKGVNIIIATAPPYVSLLVGAIIAKITGVKLILDYRDPWTAYAWPDRLYRDGGAHRKLEAWVMSKASAIIFASQTMSDEYCRFFSAWSKEKSFVITNGYDPLLRRSDLCEKFDSGKQKRLLYAGNFYGERSIWLVLAPLLELIKRGRIKRNEVVIDVYGSISASDWEKIKTYDVCDLVRECESLGHGEMLIEMMNADVLFLLSGRDVSYALPYKIFDYLSAGKPILAVAPKESELVQFMAPLDCGVCVAIDDPDAISQALLDLLVSEKTFGFNGIEKFCWEQLAIKYLQVVGDVIG